MSNTKRTSGVSGLLLTGGRGRSSMASQSANDYPLEVTQLLDVFARIESRRQSRLRALRKEVN